MKLLEDLLAVGVVECIETGATIPRGRGGIGIRSGLKIHRRKD